MTAKKFKYFQGFPGLVRALNNDMGHDILPDPKQVSGHTTTGISMRNTF